MMTMLIIMRTNINSVKNMGLPSKGGFEVLPSRGFNCPWVTLANPGCVISNTSVQLPAVQAQLLADTDQTCLWCFKH